MFVNIIKHKIFATERRFLSKFVRNISKTANVFADSTATIGNENQNNEIKTEKLSYSKNHDRMLSNIFDAAINKAQRELMASYPAIVDEIINIEQYPEHEFMLQFKELLKQFLEYNVPIQVNSPNSTVFLAYNDLAKAEDLTSENLRLAKTLNWCNELWRVAYFLEDDILDASEKRSGKPCWYKLQDVGNRAVNDITLINSYLYTLLQRHFQNKPYYINILELFHDTQLESFIGQCLDIQTSSSAKKPNLNLFTMDQYNTIVKYKAVPTVRLPVLLAMNMAGIKDPEMYHQAKTVLAQLGHFIQIKNDFNDCFDVEKTKAGKCFGDDIRRGTCTWLAVVALQHATPEQRKIMERCYGSNNPDDIAAIKNLYEILNIPHIYADTEEAHKSAMYAHFEQISNNFPPELWLKIMRMNNEM